MMVRRKFLLGAACYVAVVMLALSFSYLRERTQRHFAVTSAPDSLPEYPVHTTPPDENAKPFFSLVTNRTYGTGDRARVWVNYRGIDSLDFRIYRVNDPVKFFKQLDNPHQVGEDEPAVEGGAAGKRRRPPTLLEKLRAFKNRIYIPIKNYVRAQLQHQSRKSFNQKFRSGEEDETVSRTPLNVADYARVPLLNPDQMVSSWREQLPPLADLYDRRTIPLGRREAGVYLIEAVNGDLRAYSVAIITDLTMVQKTARDGQLLVYAVNRKTGAPRDGVRVEAVRGRQVVADGVTDEQGLLRTKIEKKPAARQTEDEDAAGDEEVDREEEASGEAGAVSNSFLLMATAGADFAISDLDSFYFSAYEEGGNGEAGGAADVTSYVYTDRPVYRPAQRVYFKGILRQLTESGYRLIPGDYVSVTVEDPNGGRVFEQDVPLSARGTFSGELEIADEAPLGSYHLTARVGGAAQASGYFEVQEYKKPEYKVTVAVPQKYVNVGERTRFAVTASYFFGAPVARADVRYYIYRSRYYPWWKGAGGGEDDEAVFADAGGGDDAAAADDAGADAYGYGGQMVAEGEGVLDARGRLEIEFTVPPPGAEETWDYTYRLEAQVTDAARRAMTGSASFVGVRGRVVATAHPEKYVYYVGDSAKILVRTADHEGHPAATRVKLTFVERRWEKVTKRTENGDEYPGYDLKERELSSAAVETNAQGDAVYEYVVPINGTIHVKTTIEEKGGQSIVAHGGTLWVADRRNEWSDFAYQGEGMIKLVPDKKSYRPGDTAHVLALLPADRAHLLVTTELMSVMTVRRIDAAGRAVVIDVPIEARHAPNIFLNVTYVKNGDMYTQDQILPVPARDRLLKLAIIPNKKEYKPRETASYTILARNDDGSPAAGAEVSLGVVDESIYQIASDNAGDIRREFYGRRYNQVQTTLAVFYSFTGYAGRKSPDLAQLKKPYQAADLKNVGEAVNPRIRRLFKDTAFWRPDVVTGADGRATLSVELPDNLTTWRATARAITADTRVGTATEKVVARKDVILRLALPRFLTSGDTITLSGIVHNYLPSEKTTQISIEVSGGQLLDAPVQTVMISRQGEHRVDWRVAVPNTGELKILAKALTDTESDAIETSLDIVPRGLKQTRGETIALSDEEAEQSYAYRLPANADPYARALRIEITPSIAGTLFGALDYLTGYPYGCTEQTMSQFLPTVIVAHTLRNVSTATIRDTNNINRKVRSGLRRLYNHQHEDGGWGWWKDDPTDPFMSAYVVDGLAMARRAGYDIDATRLERGRDKLKQLLDAGKTDEGRAIDTETRAYMVYAHGESGAGTDARYVNELFANRGSLQPYGRALLALALTSRGDERRARLLAGEIERSANVGGTGAFWASQYKADDFTQANDVEATALSVKALARLAPRSNLLPKAARWLVMNRRHGHYWLSTKETAFAIFGLTDYLKVSEELSPDYTVEVYLNGEQVLARRMSAADAAAAQTFVIERKGTEVGGESAVQIVKRGRGVLYLTTTLIHHTNEEQVAAQGGAQLNLTREYLRLRVEAGGGRDGDDSAPAWKLEPLRGELRTGDVIVSRLHVEGAGGARYLLIEDPIPAGCEQIASVSGIDLSHTEKDWSHWYSAREFRDQKTAFFVSHFDGRATYQYAMRVQVPGRFRIAPARVEQMYQPTVQANTTSSSLTIEDRK